MTVNEQVNPLRISRLRFFSRASGVSVVIIGGLVLIGWTFDISLLKSVDPGLATMKANTAVGFFLSGTALWFSNLADTNLWNKRIAVVLGSVVALLGLLTLAQYIFRLNLGIDELLFKDPATAATSHPGRMSPITAGCYFLFGLALVTLNTKPYQARLGQSFALAATAMSFIALLGYIYGVRSLYQVVPYTSIAIHTAVSFLILGCGLLSLHPTRGLMQIITSDAIGGIILRRLLPVVIIAPVVIGWLRLWGQAAGFYDLNFGVALLTTVNIILLSAFLWRNAEHLNQIDALRRLNEERFHQLVDSTPSGLILVNHEGKIALVNAQMEQLFGYQRSELIGQSVEVLIPERFRDLHTSYRVDFQIHPQSRQMGMGRDLFGLRRDGSEIPVEIGLNPIQTVEGPFVLAAIIDLTERKKTDLALQDAEQKYRTIVEQSPIVVYLDEVGGNWQYVSPQIERLLGYSVEEWMSNPNLFREHIHTDDIQKMEKAIRESQRNHCAYSCEFRFIKPGGEILWLHDEAIFIKDEINNRMLMQGVLYDITKQKFAEDDLHHLNLTLEKRIAERTSELEREIIKRKEAEEALRQEAIRDPLTQLFNRRFMEESLSREIRRAKRKGNTSLVIVMIDFDHFKKFNDTFGHDGGDEVLRSFGAFLKTKIREADIACRYGGEEFTLILPDASLEDACRRMEELRSVTRSQKIRHEQNELGGFTLSMGISVFPDHGATVETLLKKADNALYRAKEAGRDRIVIGQ